MTQDSGLLERAMNAWLRVSGRDQPSQYGSEVLVLDGLRYVVLRNGRGPLAVYRVRPDGSLRSLRRWPKAV